MNKKEAELEAIKKAKSAQAIAGKVSGMSGRDLVCFSSTDIRLYAKIERVFPAVLLQSGVV